MVNPVAFTIFGKDIYWYGIIMAFAVFVGVLLAMRGARKKGYHSDLIIDFAILAVPVAFICARLYYVAGAWGEFADDPSRIIRIWEGGIAIFGGILGGLLAALIFSKWRKTSFLDLCDIVAPSLILGQALGRWGNFFNQEVYGLEVTNASLQWFPLAVMITRSGRTHWYLALFFYECLWNLAVFAVLWWYAHKKPRPRGNTFLLYISLYSLGRMVMEGFRDNTYILRIAGLPASALTALLFLVVGLGLFIWRSRKGQPAPAIPGGPYEYETYMKRVADKARGKAGYAPIEASKLTEEKTEEKTEELTEEKTEELTEEKTEEKPQEAAQERKTSGEE